MALIVALVTLILVAPRSSTPEITGNSRAAPPPALPVPPGKVEKPSNPVPVLNNDRQVSGVCNRSLTLDLPHNFSSPAVSPESAGKPLLCWYRIRAPGGIRNFIIQVNFRRFRLGYPANATHCNGGSLQIVDGLSPSNTTITNRFNPGYFCGEAEQPQTFISETPSIRMTFRVTNFSEATYWSFDVRSEPQLSVYLRHGQRTGGLLYPNRRGAATNGTYCDRTFTDCRLQTCSVQSPAYPGVPPRGLRCRYRLSTREAHIKLYLENEVFNFGGQRCENAMTCPMRPVSSGEENCPDDKIRVYDGVNETAPLIGTFCGMGSFPHNIIGSGKHILVEAITTPAGPLLLAGFQFAVDETPESGAPASLPSPPPHLGGTAAPRVLQGAVRLPGRCSWRVPQLALRTANSSVGIFLSERSWYPPYTVCDHLIVADPGHVVRLNFPSFRAEPITAGLKPWEGDCGESLTLFDSDHADDTAIIRTFCDTFSKPSRDQDFVSKGRYLFARFESKTGSYAGSSLYYLAHYEFFNDSSSGDRVLGKDCDEEILSWKKSSGVLHSPTNTLVYRRPGSSGPVSSAAISRAPDVTCTYYLVTNEQFFARVELIINKIAFKEPSMVGPSSLPVPGAVAASPDDCWSGKRDRLLIWEPSTKSSSEPDPNNQTKGAQCLHRNMTGHPIRIVSQGRELLVRLQLPAATAEKYFRSTSFLFEARFRFVHGAECGRVVQGDADGGLLQFPALPPGGSGRDIRCLWEIPTSVDSAVWLRFANLRFTGNSCASARLQIWLGKPPDVEGAGGPWFISCGGDVSPLPLIQPSQLPYPGANISVHLSAESLDSVNFALRWTTLRRATSSPGRLTDATVELGSGDGDGGSIGSDLGVAAGTGMGIDRDAACGFKCPGGSGLCVPAKLVCNNIIDCPPLTDDEASALENSDESAELCSQPESTEIDWWPLVGGAAGVAGGIAILLTMFVVVGRCGCCRQRPRHIDVPY